MTITARDGRGVVDVLRAWWNDVRAVREWIEKGEDQSVRKREEKFTLKCACLRMREKERGRAERERSRKEKKIFESWEKERGRWGKRVREREARGGK